MNKWTVDSIVAYAKERARTIRSECAWSIIRADISRDVLEFVDGWTKALKRDKSIEARVMLAILADVAQFAKQWKQGLVDDDDDDVRFEAEPVVLEIADRFRA